MGSADASFGPDAETPDLGAQDAMPAPDATDDASAPDAASPDATDDASAPDAASPDATNPDATPLDGTLPDATAPDATTVDAGPVPECNPPALIDLNQAGTLTGTTTRYVGSDTSVAAGVAIQAPSCATDYGHPVVFKYTPRQSDRIKVNTNTPNTTFDTVVWALASCSAIGTSELGCDDNTGVAPNTNASEFVTAMAVTAGTPIYIVVAGHSNNVGTFELRVTELAPSPIGGPCDLLGTGDSYCTAGTSCVPPVTNPFSLTGVCLKDGTQGGLCRTTSPACDSGLACDPNTAFPFGLNPVCVPVIPLGGMCDPNLIQNLCADPNQCSTGGTCVAPPFTEMPIQNPHFIDACATGTHVSTTTPNRDDGHSPAGLTIPFTFQYLGAAYTLIWPDTNGYAVFGPNPPLDISSPSMLAQEGPAIAPFWDDLVFPPAPGSDLCYLTVGTAPSRQFVIEWLDAFRYSAVETHLTFELVLEEGTNAIDMIYRTLASDTTQDAVYVDGSQALIGLQGPNGVPSIRHSGTVSAGTGIRWTP
jgi:hypothetical protein